MRVHIEDHLHFKFKNKCFFYSLTMQEVISLLLSKFVDGEFDKDFEIDKMK